MADLKISPEVPLSGAEHYDRQVVRAAPGVCQVACSAINGTVFIASATGRGDKGTSSLVKFDAKTMENLAEAAPRFDSRNGLYCAF